MIHYIRCYSRNALKENKFKESSNVLQMSVLVLINNATFYFYQTQVNILIPMYHEYT